MPGRAAPPAPAGNGTWFIDPPPVSSNDFSIMIWKDWFQQVYSSTLLPIVPEYTVASVPDATIYVNGLIAVSDETGGHTIAFSDGTNWRRVQDRAIIS